MFRKPDGAGKGDSPRPIPDREKFESNWDNIFGKKSNDRNPVEEVHRPVDSEEHSTEETK